MDRKAAADAEFEAKMRERLATGKRGGAKALDPADGGDDPTAGMSEFQRMAYERAQRRAAKRTLIGCLPARCHLRRTYMCCAH